MNFLKKNLNSDSYQNEHLHTGHQRHYISRPCWRYLILEHKDLQKNFQHYSHHLPIDRLYHFLQSHPQYFEKIKENKKNKIVL